MSYLEEKSESKEKEIFELIKEIQKSSKNIDNDLLNKVDELREAVFKLIHCGD